MARRNPFHRIRLVYRRSPMILKILVLVTILASAAALLALRFAMTGFQEQRQALYTQAVDLQQENEDLTERIAELGTKDSIRRIAIEELDLMDPKSELFNPGQ